MKRPFTIAIALLPLVAAATPLQTDCSCALARKTNGWCTECNVGYVASITIPSRTLFEALDAHGHDIDPALLSCDACTRAREADGFCERCGLGFLRGQAYLSRLAHAAATGELIEPSAIRCASCRENAKTSGWCGICDVAMVGRLALRSPMDLETVAEEFGHLHRALRVLADCEACAVATFAGGRCPLCRKSYARPGAR